jgi:uncharacterized membrane protein
MSKQIRAYTAALAVILLCDGLWLGLVARDLYAREMAGLMADDVRLLPAALFYFGYPAGLVMLALPGAGMRITGLLPAAARGALVGLMSYGTYDLTNLAVVRGWSPMLTVVDLAWGVCISTLAATAGAAFARRGQPALRIG